MCETSCSARCLMLCALFDVWSDPDVVARSRGRSLVLSCVGFSLCSVLAFGVTRGSIFCDDFQPSSDAAYDLRPVFMFLLELWFLVLLEG